MTESELLGLLKYDYYRKIVEACEKNPRSAAEIAELTNQTARECGERLETLERRGGLTFSDKGWTATQEAIKVLNKYLR